QHRVRANAATATTAHFEAVFAARDADALPTLLADEYHVVDHTTGVTYDRQGELTSYRALMRARDPTLRTEPLATLGDSLSLSRVSMSASGFVGGTFDVGAYEREQIALNEVDANGRRRRAELFAADRLGDAIVRLYERYAELLPDGPARARAAATARSVATMLGPFEFRYPVPFSPTVEVVDHRILGTWSARGAEALLQHNRSLLQVADDITLRDDEVLSLQADALLVRRTNSGTDRAGGGAYERVFLALYVFGTDGLVTRIEYFDTDREDQALARLDELPAAPAAVRLAAALSRSSISAGGYAGANLDVGAYEREDLVLIEVEAQGRRRWTESFARDHLSDAIARLYARYADLLPDGPARARAAATARSVATMLGPFELDRYPTPFSPTVEVVDHRILGTWSARGAEALLEVFRSWLPLADDITLRDDEVLDLRPDALLVRRTHAGTDRAGGGAYERVFLALYVFGADGLVTRIEFFDTDREDQALARFDELTAEPATPRIANAETRRNDRLREAWAARDWERVAACFAPGFRLIDRRSYAHLELDRDQHLESLRMRFDMSSSRLVSEVFATRGDRLALGRARFELADRDVGPSESELLWIGEADEHGDCA